MSTPTIKPHQVAESFVAVPGIIVPVMFGSPSSTGTVSTDVYTDINSNFTNVSAVVPVAGQYILSLKLGGIFASGGCEPRFRVLVDSSPVTEDSKLWEFSTGTARESATLSEPVELTAGSHNFTVQWKRQSGSGTLSFDTVAHLDLRAVLISGSGAGGNIIASAAKTADQVVAFGSTVKLTELDLVFTTQDRENVVIHYQIGGNTNSATLSSVMPLYRLDGGAWTPLLSENAQWERQVTGSFVLSSLSAGAHTVEFAVYVNLVDLTVYGGDTSFFGYYPVSRTWAVQDRGGLVPIQHDGVDVISTPRALNFQGTSLQVTEDNDVVNIGLGPAVTAPGYIETQQYVVSSDINTSDGTPKLVFEQDFTLPYRGTYSVIVDIQAWQTWVSSQTAYFYVVIDEGDPGELVLGGSSEWMLSLGTASVFIFTPSYRANASLTEGTHQFRVYARNSSAGGSYLRFLAGSASNATHVTVQTVTGSGAGGVLTDLQTNATDVACPVGSPTVINTHVITTADETVLLDLSFPILMGGLSSYDVYYRVDGGTWVVFGRDGDPGGYAVGIAAQTRIVLSAGTHTIEVGCQGVSSSVTVQGLSVWPARSTVWQYRGGLVPIREDGVTVLDKPAALNFQGAAIVEDANGVANIRLPEAITAPGVRVELSDGIASDKDYTTSYERLIPDPNGIPTSMSFVAPHPGSYEIKLIFEPAGVTSSESWMVKIVFDEGAATEQTIGDDSLWQGRSPGGASTQAYVVNLSGQVDLIAGSHTVTVYLKELGTGGTLRIFGTGSPYYYYIPRLILTAITGSGAGGILVDRVSSTAFPQTITAGFDLGNYDDINNLSTTVEVSEGEQLLITLRAQGLPVTTSSAVGRTRILVGSDPYLVAQVSATTQLDMNLGGSIITAPLTAGTYTVKAQAANNSTLADIYINLWADMEVTRFRGGLVPILNDGVLIQDKAHSINLLGPGLQATNVDGKVNVSVQSAVEGVELDAATKGSDQTITTGSTQKITGLDLAFNTVEGENVLITWSMFLYTGSGSQSSQAILMRVDGGSWFVIESIQSPGYWSGSASSYLLAGLSAGSHTVEFGCECNVVNADVLGGDTGMYSYYPESKSWATQIRGGYVQPENIPILAYSSASVINVQAAPGAASRLWVHLNDGVRYHADGTLTINLASSGLGGLDTGTEAVSTWYYCYAVPSTTSGEFGVVASVTDPASGGPTGFTAWKYLGAVRNDASGNLIKWFQLGDRFWFVKKQVMWSTVGGPDTVRQSIDISSRVPATAGEAHVLAYWQPNNTFGTMWLYIYGEGTDADADAFDLAASPVNWGGQNRGLWLPVPNGRYIDIKRTALANGNRIDVNGWRDEHLTALSSQTQTEYTPDTPPPRGTWIDATEVDFAAWPGHGSTLRLALSDAKTRIASGTLAVDTANGVADLGYDDASSQGNTKWIYFYAVPKTGDDDQFTVVMSDNPPSTGPLGRSASKYLWSTYIDGSGNLLEVIQTTPSEFIYRAVPSASVGVTSRTSYDASAYCPETASMMRLLARGDNTAGVEIWSIGGTGYPEVWAGGLDSDICVGECSIEGTPRGFDYRVSNATGQIAFIGWTDAYLAADAGIGAVTGGAGTTSPLTTKGDLWSYDTGDQRLPVGADDYVLTADSAEDTGIKWAPISHPTQAYLIEEAFTTDGTETPGETVSHVIAATPRAAGTICGYDIVVFRNGVKLKNVASLTSSYNEFTFTVGTLTVAVLASGDADEYDVDFRS
jgi:hypothetical protein